LKIEPAPLQYQGVASTTEVDPWLPVIIQHEPSSDVPGHPDAARPLDLMSVHADHADDVWNILRRLGVRASDRDDQVQEVFLIVHKKLGTFDRERPLLPWLYGICKNVARCYHIRRSKARRREAPGELTADDLCDVDGLSPEEALQARQARAELEAVLDGLEIEKRAVFIMFEVERMSYDEIASILGIPPGTVGSRLNSARNHVRRTLSRRTARKR
jgi:RNA polymerase sigma-70 factor (ECF subfamily)